MKGYFKPITALALGAFFSTSLLAQTQLRVIEKTNEEVNKEQTEFTPEQKKLLGQLLSELGVEESVDEILETKDIKIVISEQAEPRTRHHAMPFAYGTTAFHAMPNKAFLGIQFNQNSEEGLVIEKVISNSAAEKMGLKAGDKILSVDGIEIGEKGLHLALKDKKPGGAIEIKVEREGKTQTLSGELGKRERPSEVEIKEMLKDIEVDIEEIKEQYKLQAQPTKRKMLGVELSEVLDDNDKVLVGRVIENSPAEEMGLQEGDIIKEINGQTIEHINDVVDAVKATEVGDKLKVTVERNGKKVKAKGNMSEVEYTPQAVFMNKKVMKCDDVKKMNEHFKPGSEDCHKIIKMHGQHPEMMIHRMQMMYEGDQQVYIISNRAKSKDNSAEEFEIEINDASDQGLLNVYPNPTDGLMNIQVEVKDGETGSVKVYDAGNKLIFENEYNGNGGMIMEQIDLSTSPAGVYIIQFETGGEKEIQKIIIE
ncbi:MAG: PDZ domain-containing protein [Bacteroidetes bacterium]|nr:PDZ domain-containing protein [Bacteroidota bacterium]